MADWFDLRRVLGWLSEQDPGLGTLLIGAGLVFLILGWRMSRFMVAVSLAVMLAAVAGYATAPGPWVIPALLSGAAVGAAMGAGLPTLSTALVSGGWAAALILGAMMRSQAGSGATMIACAVAFLAVGSMAFAAKRPCVAFVTSVQGTVLFVFGSLVLVARLTNWWGFVRDAVENNPIFLPFCLLAGTVIGYYIQLAAIQEKETGLTVNL